FFGAVLTSSFNSSKTDPDIFLTASRLAKMMLLIVMSLRVANLLGKESINPSLARSFSASSIIFLVKTALGRLYLIGATIASYLRTASSKSIPEVMFANNTPMEWFLILPMTGPTSADFVQQKTSLLDSSSAKYSRRSLEKVSRFDFHSFPL